MVGIDLVFLIVALVCFAVAAVNVPSPVNLTAAGLFFWCLTLVV